MAITNSVRPVAKPNKAKKNDDSNSKSDSTGNLKLNLSLFRGETEKHEKPLIPTLKSYDLAQTRAKSDMYNSSKEIDKMYSNAKKKK